MLFERTNHMARVCSDLHSMVAATHSLRHFLGPELKAATGDVQVSPFLSFLAPKSGANEQREQCFGVGRLKCR